MGMQGAGDGTAPQSRARITFGDRLGRFEILGALGAGGMGQVYRARDPQLLRDVAIKVLATQFRVDPEGQRRFEREARATASLNHPNVLAIHDFGVDEGIAFIVTELLEGQTLRQRIAERPLPPHKAVEYAIQIASGLASGHERGIVHRDIKPDNLFLTTEDRIKILDFGLAKVVDPAASDITSTARIDDASVAAVVGTAAYMSPEQARGLRTDSRSDIFSAGVVLYEMLAGFAPFRRGNAGQSLQAVLNDEPPELRGIAPELARIVGHCLEKDAERRFQNARDLIFALQSLSPESLKARATRPFTTNRTAMIIGAVLIAVLTAALGYVLGRHATSPAPPAATVPRVDRLTDFPGIEEFPAISPDGRSVAFTASVSGRRQLFVRLIAGGMPVQVTRDELDHQMPRWSPDGNSLFYYSPAGPEQTAGHIWSVPALGGSPKRVMESIGGGDVSPSGRLACFQLHGGAVRLVNSASDGSEVRVVAALAPGYHLYPRWSPDERWIAFQRGDGVRFDLFVIAATGGEVRQLTRDKNAIRGLSWLPDSRALAYASSRANTVPYLPPISLWRIGLDAQAPRQITSADLWYEQPDFHGSGVVAATRVQMRFDIWRFPFGDEPAENVRRAEQITHQTGEVLTPTAAPDGEHIAFLSDSGGHANLWVTSPRSSEPRQITFEDDPDVSIGVPLWSPDGKSIAFVSSKGRGGFDFGVWLVDPDGTNARTIVPKGLGAAWSPDGRWLYYAETAAGMLNKVPASGGTPVRVRSEQTRNVIGIHARSLYYTVEHALLDGRAEIEIRAATPETGPSRAIARIPAWRVPGWQIVNPALSPDGEWLAIPLTDRYTTNIWALSTRTGAWRQVTDFGERATFIARHVSWSPDGKAIFAAVGEGEADVVLLRDLIRGR